MCLHRLGVSSRIIQNSVLFWVSFRLATDVGLFVTGRLASIIRVTIESADRFAATIDGLVMH